MNPKLFFDSIKEKHDRYFIEYYPPMHGFLFANLQITYMYDIKLHQMKADMEELAKKWVKRYPVSLMVSAFDDHGRLISFSGGAGESYLIALKVDGSFDLLWKSVPDSSFPTEVLDADYLLSVYKDINFRTQEEIRQSAQESLKPMRRLKFLILIWAVFIPALIAVLEFFSPTWVALIALAYSLWQAYQKYLIMTGRKVKKDAEIEKEKEKQRMEHHHYHCELNPDGFVRLRNENFKADAKYRTRKEYDALS
ncbi:hypothetical protein [Gilvimarinus xylanilyticus]|uniref:Uncharacterized protein n=1 Tax=Gilvimarinus xylanilyticus TaxID=2944139 RepID=A0A9X2I3K0_9GAMM|nr:hypothetical protein [Gilvimarinus xylanilyticus]MCP8898307.1 hypothetical protein [Gilvimarinus xylanilyticus]